MNTNRFKVGDRVRIVRSSITTAETGVITEILSPGAYIALCTFKNETDEHVQHILDSNYNGGDSDELLELIED